jgi:hypothetical protein
MFFVSRLFVVVVVVDVVAECDVVIQIIIIKKK